LHISNLQETIQINREIKAQLQKLKKLQYNREYREHSAKSLRYDNRYKIKQGACTFQFVCKRSELKHAIFPELWAL